MPPRNSASDLLQLHRQQQLNSSLLNQNIFFYFVEIRMTKSRREQPRGLLHTSAVAFPQTFIYPGLQSKK
jgi:hypothetical protein